MITLGRQNGDEICNPDIDHEIIFSELNTFDNLCYLFAKKTDGSVIPLEKIPFPNSFGFEQQTNIDYFTEGRLIYGIANKTDNDDVDNTYYSVSGSELINLPYYAEGFSLLIKFKQTNIGKVFICINNISFKEVVKTTYESLTGGELKTDGIYLVAYDGEHFQMVNYLGGNNEITGDVTVLSYNELKTLALTNQLVTGREYLIKDYRTRSEIPYSQIEQGDIYTPEIYEHFYDGNKLEPLLIKAVSSNKIGFDTKSTLFWQDQIYYDLFANENGSDRGKIFFRRDTINDLETGYDFRGIKFRRWFDLCDKAIHFLPVWQFSFADLDFTHLIELVSLNISINGVLSEIEFNQDLPKFDWDLPKYTILDKMVELLSNHSDINKWFDVFEVKGVIYFRMKINWDWKMYKLDVNYFNLKLNKISQPTPYKRYPAYSQTELYCDLFTFTGIIKNVHIKPIDTYISENYKWYYSNNILLSDEVGVSIRNVRIGYNSINNTLLSGNHEISINDFTSHNLLKQGGSFIYLGDKANLNWFESYTENNSIGIGSFYNFIIDAAKWNEIGVYSSWNWIMNNTNNNKIGGYSHRNFLTETCQWNIIGNNSSDNFMGHQSTYNILGNSSNDNWLDDWCSYNIINDNSSNNELGRYCLNNELDLNCDNNKIDGESSNNELGRESKNNILGLRSKDNKFGDFFNNNHFGSEIVGNQFGDYCEFNIIGNRMRNNNIGNYFHNNNLGNDFRENEWGDFGYENIIGSDAQMNKVGDKCFKNIIGNAFWRNFWGDNCICNEVYGCHENNFIMAGAQYNFFGNLFRHNQVGNTAVHNSFMEECIFNVLGDDFGSNTCTMRFQNNRIGARCQANIFGIDFKNNRLGNEFRENVIGHDANGNEIGDQMYQCQTNNTFDYNKIGDKFQWVYIEEGCCYNEIGSGFNGLSDAVPSRIGRDFKYNILGNNYKRLIFPMYYQYNKMDIDNINNYVDIAFLEIGAGLNNDPIKKKILNWNKSTFQIWVDYASVVTQVFDINPYRDWGGIFNFVNNTNNLLITYNVSSINVVTTPYLNENDKGLVTWEIELRPLAGVNLVINSGDNIPNEMFDNIVLQNGVQEITLSGDNHEWIRFQQRNEIWYEISKGLY